MPARRRAAPKGKAKLAETVYQRRIRRYAELHPGATKQAARGKKPREHVIRKEREIEKSGLTSYQKSQIKKFADAAGARLSGNPADAIYHDLVFKAQARGYEDFKRLPALVAKLSRETKRSRNQRVIRIEGRAAHAAEMQELADDWDIDLEWLFYN